MPTRVRRLPRQAPDEVTIVDGPDFTLLGIVVGHATDVDGATGCTVVRGIEGPMRGAVAVLGRATGSRELATLAPEHLAGRVDAVLLAGGSAYGLDAAAGVMRWMEEHGRGFPVGEQATQVVPIVPAAVVFDLLPLGRFDARPTAAMAYDACERATATGIAEGSVGAGAGTTVGKLRGAAGAMKGGVGVAVARGGGEHGPMVGAVVVLNAFGDVRDAAGAIIAGARDGQGAWLDTERTLATGAAGAGDNLATAALRNTTLAVVATDAALTRVELGQLARAAGAAYHRRITPAATSLDGDTIVALCPGATVPPAEGTRIAALMQIEALAVAALGDAIERAVRRARGRDGVPGLADAGFHPPAS